MCQRLRQQNCRTAAVASSVKMPWSIQLPDSWTLTGPGAQVPSTSVGGTVPSASAWTNGSAVPSTISRKDEFGDNPTDAIAERNAPPLASITTQSTTPVSSVVVTAPPLPRGVAVSVHGS